MERQWEQYSYKNRGGWAKVLQATLNHRGWIMFNQHTWQELGHPRQAVLLYDRLAGVIGVRSARPLETHTLYVATVGKSGNRAVKAKAFCRELKINIDRTVSFTAPTLENGVLVLDLAKTRPLGGGRRISEILQENGVFRGFAALFAEKLAFPFISPERKGGYAADLHLIIFIGHQSHFPRGHAIASWNIDCRRGVRPNPLGPD